MTETPKKAPDGRTTPPKNPARAAGNEAATVTAQRRQSKRQLAEQERQRRVLALLGGTLGIVAVVLLSGLIYDQVWVPSRPVASVGSTTLNTRDYRQEQRYTFARQIAQNFQLLGLFAGNAQISGQFAGQSPGINQQVREIGDAPVNEETVNQWIDRELQTQGASIEGIAVTQDEINQALVGDLGQIFLPPPVTAPTSTTTLTPTAELSPTADVSPTTALTPEASPTAAFSPTPEPTATTAPSATPLPTPAPAEAADQVGQIIDELFRRFEIELAPSRAEPALSKDDFRNALNAQYREQVITRKVQEKLVSDEGFTPSEEPDRVSARQVLIAVATAEGASQQDSDAAFAEALPRAEAVAEALRGGADFASVAAEQSDDAGSKENGGELGSFDAQGVADNGATYAPELVAAAFGLEEGSISDPIRTQFGWHVIEVTERTIPERDEQLREARTAAFDEWVAAQRTAISNGRIPPATPTATLEATPEPSATAVPTFVPGPPTVAPTVPVEETPPPSP